MSAVLRIAWREIVERRVALVAAALVAGLVAVSPWLPWWSRWPAGEVRAVAALVLASTLGGVLALGLGVSLLGTDLSEGRLGFYLSRPISPVALWAGKVLGAWALVVGTIGVVLLPALAHGGLASRVDLPVWVMGVAACVGPLLLVTAAHAAGVMWRSRSVWLAADALAVVALGAVAVVATRRLALEYATTAAWVVGLGCGAALLVGLTLAGGRGLARGRVSAAATHRALSRTLWAVLGAAVLASAGYAQWVLSASPGDLSGIESVDAAPRGPWVTVGGPVRLRGGYRAQFLFDTATGRFLRLGLSIRSYRWTPVFSADGRRAVWLAATGRSFDDPAQVMVADLAGVRPTAVATTLLVAHPLGVDLILSPDGRRLAVTAGPEVAVYDVPSMALRGAARLPDGHLRARGAFVDGRLRLYTALVEERRSAPRNEDRQLDIYAFDADARTLVRTGTTGPLATAQYLFTQLSPDGTRLLVLRVGETRRTLTLHDAVTGASLATLFDDERLNGGSTAFLADGRIVVTVIAGGRAALSLFAPDGSPAGRIDVGPGRRVRLGAEPVRGSITLALFPSEDDAWPHARTMLVELRDGRITPLGEGLVPVGEWLWFRGQMNEEAAPGSVGSTLFSRWTGEGGPTLVRLDPGTGVRTTVLGPR